MRRFHLIRVRRAVGASSDQTPDQFTFTDQTGVLLSTVITSAAVTISGLGSGVSITLNAVGGTIDRNGDGVFLSSSTVQNGDTVRARVTSSASNSTAVNCTVTASPSGIFDTFTATTLAAGSSGDPVILYTDIQNGPTTGGENNNGAYLSIFGVNFGSAGDLGTAAGSRVYINDVEVASYISQGDAIIASHATKSFMKRITVQVGALGGLTVGTAYTLKVVTNGVTSNTDHTFRRTSGRMIYVIASGTNGSGTFASPYTLSGYISAGVTASDHVILRGGSYNSIYGSQYGTYQMSFAKAWGGGVNAHTTFMGYPGETPAFSSDAAGLGTGGGNFRLFDSGEDAGDGFCFSNIQFLPNVSAIDFGGRGSAQKANETSTGSGRCKGASNTRLVNCDIVPTYTTTHASANLVVSGDSARILGCYDHDAPAQAANNLNHAMYINCGADDVEVGWCVVKNITGGHMIQVHTDWANQNTGNDYQGNPFLGLWFDNFRVHDCVITHDDSTKCRGLNTGITHTGIAPTTWGTAGTGYGAFYNNILYNVGQSFGGIVLNSANTRVYNNTLWDIDNTNIIYTVHLVAGASEPVADVRNNIVHSVVASAVGVTNVAGAPSGKLTVANNCYRGTAAVNGGDAGAVTGDPLFTNEAGSDFSLAAGSSCIGTGSSGGAVATTVVYGAEGNPRPQSGTYDIGAYERAA